jgi:hypothetical protein
MLYLNNPYLTSENIIYRFEKDVLDGVPPKHANAPSLLQQFKNKLAGNFFQELNDEFNQKKKQISPDEQSYFNRSKDIAVLEMLLEDGKFNSSYPYLQHVLVRIFFLDESFEKEVALEQLKHPPSTSSAAIGDWNAEQEASQFEALNARYGYFQNMPENQQEALHALFKKLIIACRMMIVLFEQNNTPNDTMAYDYAYKLMAIFVDPTKDINVTKLFDYISKKTYKILTQSDTKRDKPFHDVLLVRLQLPDARKLSDIAGWRALIETEGDKAFYFLSMAEKLEEKIAEQKQEPKRAPKNKQEAEAMAVLCNYKRAGEDLEFSQLCHTHKVPENRFNACLKYMNKSPGWPKKTSDTIPDIQVKGQGEAEGFYWVKLPANDKRALILGDITDCCQSISGDSERCVKDAVSLSDNGLYVLLKQRKKGHQNPIIDGSINEKDFSIIGQSYTWKSKTGNICLDSIECLRDSISKEALQSILTDFSTQLLEDDPDVRFVTIGQGGKTPEGLFDEAPIPEKIKQGLDYGDAKRQYCIVKKACTLEELPDEIQPQRFRDRLDYLRYYLKPEGNFLKKLTHLLKEDPALPNKLTPESLALFLSLNSAPTLDELASVDFDALDSMNAEARASQLQNISHARLLWRQDTPEELFRAFQYIPKETQGDILSIVCQTKPDLFVEFTKEYFEAIKLDLSAVIQSADNFNKIIKSLSIEQRTEVFELIKKWLPELISSTTDFEEVLEYLLPEQRTTVFEQVKERLPDLISSADDFNDVFKYLLPEQRTDVFEQVKERLPDFISSADDFKDIFEYILPTQRVDIFEKIKYKLHEIILSVEDLGEILQVFQVDEYPEIILILRNELFERISSINDLSKLLRVLSTEQSAAVILALEEKVSTMISSPNDFSRVAMHLPPEQCSVLFNSSKEKLIASPVILFIGCMSHLPLDHYSVEFKAIEAQSSKIISSIDDLCRLLVGLSSEKRTVIFDSVKKQLPMLISSTGDLRATLLYITPEQCTFILNEVRDRQSELIPSIDAFKNIVLMHTPEKRMATFLATKNQVSTLIHSEEDLKSVLSLFYSADQKNYVSSVLNDLLLEQDAIANPTEEKLLTACKEGNMDVINAMILRDLVSPDKMLEIACRSESLTVVRFLAEKLVPDVIKSLKINNDLNLPDNVIDGCVKAINEENLGQFSQTGLRNFVLNVSAQ